MIDLKISTTTTSGMMVFVPKPSIVMRSHNEFMEWVEMRIATLFAEFSADSTIELRQHATIYGYYQIASPYSTPQFVEVAGEWLISNMDILGCKLEKIL